MKANTRLQRARVACNWRQSDLADQLGTTVVTVRRWERGSHQPSTYYRIKLCELFDMSAQELGLVPLAQSEPEDEDQVDAIQVLDDPDTSSLKEPEEEEDPVGPPDDGEKLVLQQPRRRNAIGSGWLDWRQWVRPVVVGVLVLLIMGGVFMATNGQRLFSPASSRSAARSRSTTHTGRTGNALALAPLPATHSASAATPTATPIPVATPTTAPVVAAPTATPLPTATPITTGNTAMSAPVQVIDPHTTIDPYGAGGTLALSEDMSGGDQNLPQWDVKSPGSAFGCSFSQDGYDAILQGSSYCDANATNFANFAYQVQVKIVQGQAAGISFRTDAGAGQTYYIFEVTVDGNYAIQRNDSAQANTTLSSGSSALIQTGYNSSNVLAVNANGSTMTFYINGQRIASLQDSQYSSGLIGVFVGEQDAAQAITEAVFSDARVWTY